LEYSFFPKLIADKCKITFVVWQVEIDRIYLVITDEAENEAKRVWKEEREDL